MDWLARARIIRPLPLLPAALAHDGKTQNRFFLSTTIKMAARSVVVAAASGGGARIACRPRAGAGI